MANRQLRWTFSAAALSAVILIAPPALAGAGDLDPTFGDGGKVIADMQAPSNNGIADAAVIQPDGKILVLGLSRAEALAIYFALARYNPDGSLDPSFGDGGTVLTSLGLLYANAEALALQPDGKIVVAGSARTDAGNWDFVLAGYNPDGSPDTGFGTGGTLVTDFAGGSFEHAYAVAVQPDGRIVAAGSIWDFDAQQEHFALARYWPDGRLDASFGQSGKVVTTFGKSVKALDLAVQADGKIVATGRGEVLARYNADGSLDAGFGVGGKVAIAIGANAVTVQADGRIVTAGQSYADFSLARHNPDGSPDVSFGTDGVVVVDFAAGSSWISSQAYDVVVQADGRIVAAGFAGAWIAASNWLEDFALARVMPDGSPDTSFNGDGRAILDFAGNDDSASTVAVLSDGRIVAAGSTWTLTGPSPQGHLDFALARYQADGSLDPSFGDGGKVVTDLLGPTDEAGEAVAVQADGKIVVGGTILHYDLGADFVLARFNADGSPDTGFGDGGRVSTDFGTHSEDSPWGSRWIRLDDYASAVAVQADGKILAAGRSLDPSRSWTWTSAIAVARYNPDGSLDTSFGTDGKVITYLGYRDRAYASALAVQPDGRILIAGSAWTHTVPPYEFAVVRYHPDGTLDTSFGTGGAATADVVYRHNEYAADMALQPDGRIVLVGHSPDSTNSYSIAMARFNADGGLDASFGTGGKVNTDLPDRWDVWASAVAIKAGGGIAVGGGSDGDIALFGYRSDGSLDPGFGVGGIVLSDFGVADLFDVAIQADGRIVAAGRHGFWDRAVGPDWVLRGPGWMFRAEYDFALARYEPDGSPDYSFGVGGLVTTHFGQYDYARAVALQADGKILLAGDSWFPTDRYKGGQYGQWDLTLARYEGVGTRFDELEALVFLVQELVAPGALNDGQAKSLQAKLQAAIQLIDGAKTTAAVRQIEAFLREIETLMATQILSPEQGQPLYDQAQSIAAWLVA